MGLSLATVEKIEGGKIYLGGLDLVDGTPILDIKPYLPQFESLPEARGGWATKDEHNVDAIQVTFTDEARLVLLSWSAKISKPELESVIVGVIKQDPRPVIYRGFEGQSETPYRNEHAFRLYDGDIHFKFTSASNAEVFAIKFN